MTGKIARTKCLKCYVPRLQYTSLLQRTKRHQRVSNWRSKGKTITKDFSKWHAALCMCKMKLSIKEAIKESIKEAIKEGVEEDNPDMCNRQLESIWGGYFHTSLRATIPSKVGIVHSTESLDLPTQLHVQPNLHVHVSHNRNNRARNSCVVSLNLGLSPENDVIMWGSAKFFTLLWLTIVLLQTQWVSYTAMFWTFQTDTRVTVVATGHSHCFET